MATPDGTVAIRALVPSDVEAYRALRLEALATSPEAFSSSHEEEATLSLENFRARIPTAGCSAIFGACAGAELVGMAGFAANERLKQRHKGTLVGLFVRPQWRGRGVGEQLVRHVIAHAAKHVLVLQATVVTSNHSARQMYHGLGFVPYGTERKALCIDGAFHDDELLALDLGEACGAC